MPETPVDRRSVDPLFCIQSPKAAATEGGTVFRGRPHWGSGTDASLTTRTCRRIRGQNTSSSADLVCRPPTCCLMTSAECWKIAECGPQKRCTRINETYATSVSIRRSRTACAYKRHAQPFTRSSAKMETCAQHNHNPATRRSLPSECSINPSG